MYLLVNTNVVYDLVFSPNIIVISQVCQESEEIIKTLATSTDKADASSSKEERNVTCALLSVSWFTYWVRVFSLFYSVERVSSLTKTFSKLYFHKNDMAIILKSLIFNGYTSPFKMFLLVLNCCFTYNKLRKSSSKNSNGVYFNFKQRFTYMSVISSICVKNFRNHCIWYYYIYLPNSQTSIRDSKDPSDWQRHS